MNIHQNEASLGDVHQSIDTKTNKKSWRNIFAFLGPAYLVSVGYMDPGNWATDLEGGSRYGYQLLWVLVLSNIMALVLQSLCARLGVVYKRDLAQANRDTYPRSINFILYLLAEIAIAACDLAEVLGMAIGLKLLFGLPLIWGVSITVLDTFILLYLQKMGMRRMESFIIALIAIIFVAFVIQLFMAKPDMANVLTGILPSLPDNKALYIAIGIIGATVMPHNLYLHSALVQTRKIGTDNLSIKKALKYFNVDNAIALNLALFVNAAILILAGSVFYNHHIVVTSIEDTHQLLAPMLGTKLAPILFAIALIAAGQSSTVTGTLAGQIIMEGYLQLRINPWLRRLMTRAIAIVPTLIVLIVFGENKVDELLIFSKVILIMQLAFAVIPLIIFVSDKNKMGNFAIKKPLLFASIAIAGLIIALNFKLIEESASAYIHTSTNTLLITLVIIGLLFFVSLLIATIVLPFVNKNKSISRIHLSNNKVIEVTLPVYSTIALALDFSEMDNIVLAHALNQGNANTNYVLIHIVESAPAKILGSQVADSETNTDLEQLEVYVKFIQSKGFKANAFLGYRNREKEIARITSENNANILILGAHGHKGFLDWLYGETINEVRHLVKIPVLVVK